MASSDRELKLFSNAQVVQAWMSDSSCPPQSPVPALRSNKRKRGVLQSLHPNMASKDSYLPPSTPNLKGAAKKKSRHEKHSDIAEIGAEAGEEEKTPQPRRTRGSRSSARTQKDIRGIPHDVTNEPYDQTSLVLGTPQPSLQSAYVSALEKKITLASTPKSHSLSSASGSNARSRSPVKSMADLYLSDKPIRDVMFGSNTAQLPGDIRNMYKSLKSLSDGEEVLPAAIRDKIAAVAGDMEPLRPYMFSHVLTEDANLERLSCELTEIAEIRDASRRCAQDHVSEAAWNDEVHSRILRLALKTCDGVEHQNITTARVIASLVPRHISGDSLKAKMVDYSINLKPSEKMGDRIRQLLQTQPSDLQAINQTAYGPVRYRPIAISIETKTLDASEQEARMQLGMWTAAYFNRIRSFTNEGLEMPTLPQLYSFGPQWALLFASESSSQLGLLGKLIVGDTSIVLGCYKLLAVIRHLCAWATTSFRRWLHVNVLEIKT